MSLQRTKSIKNVLILGTLFFSSVLTAQSFEIGAGAGTGAFYMIEEADNNVITAYDSPAALFFDVKYNFKDRIDGVKLRFQNTRVNIVGQDYQTAAPLNGYVTSFTTSLLYERLRADKTFNIGYHFGMGFTQQDFIQQKNTSLPVIESRFTSITGGVVYSLRLQENLRLNLNTDLLWTDPLNSLNGSENWQTAGEDLSLLIQLGVSYRF